MSDYVVPPPEPKPIDEENWRQLQPLMERAVLRAQPMGKEKCANCLYYLDTSADITYCWHPQLRVLVGGEWWCQWWEEIPEEAAAG
jgi:hypothetical protein